MGVVRVSVVFMTDLIAPSPGPRTWDPALSASRAKEYERCPLQYRLHVLDGYREPETRAKALGTVVHAVLEELFGLAPHERTPEAARSRVAPAYEAVVAKTPAIVSSTASTQPPLDDCGSSIIRLARHPDRATWTKRSTRCAFTPCSWPARRGCRPACS